MQLLPATDVQIVSEDQLRAMRLAARRTHPRTKTAAGTSDEHRYLVNNADVLPVGANFPEVLEPVPTVPVECPPPAELANAKRVPCDCEYCRANAALAKEGQEGQRYTKHKCHKCDKTYGKTSHLRAHLR